jgi:hypothetical protein
MAQHEQGSRVVKPAISVGRAIYTGSLVVNGPVFALLFGPLFVFSQLKIDRSYNWIGAVVFGVGFVLAWLWWAISVPRWRIWAYSSVENVPLLKRRAVEVGLTWPDGHFFSRTEIKSQAMHKRERELEQTAQ